MLAPFKLRNSEPHRNISSINDTASSEMHDVVRYELRALGRSGHDMLTGVSLICGLPSL